MPLYTFLCHCNARRQLFRHIEDRNQGIDCLMCLSPMERIIEAPAVRGDYSGYECPITGKWIEGRRAHEENLARHGMRVLEGGEREALQKQKGAEEEKLLSDVEATVESEIHSWEPRKREKLAAELEGGLDATVVRS